MYFHTQKGTREQEFKSDPSDSQFDYESVPKLCPNDGWAYFGIRPCLCSCYPVRSFGDPLLPYEGSPNLFWLIVSGRDLSCCFGDFVAVCPNLVKTSSSNERSKESDGFV